MTAKKKHTGFLGFLEKHEKGLVQAGLIVSPVLTLIGLGGHEAAEVLGKKSTKTKQTTKKSTTASTSSSSAATPWKQNKPYTGAYNYNAPMVKDAYFNPTPILTDDGIFGHVDLQAYDNAKKAWTISKDGKVNAAKGAIQMDRYLWTSNAAMTIISDAKKKGKSIPQQMSGFKFLYNPQTVNMTWGQSTYTNNQALLQGLDTISPVAPGSTNSSISFWIPLNRMQDANYLNPDGTYLWSDDKLTQSFDTLNYELNNLNKALGNKQNLPSTPTVPYSYDVPIAERKAIYEKGTMYDIEWLMKTINGWAFLDHTSDVSGLKTNDMGFLLQFPVELHLGNSMRYRVQVTDINVSHVIFNSRMIPIWSTINITCRRFPDYNFADIAAAVSKNG